jgi:hypothetical protein
MDGSALNPEANEAQASAAASPAGERTVVPAGAQPASSEGPSLSSQRRVPAQMVRRRATSGGRSTVRFSSCKII